MPIVFNHISALECTRASCASFLDRRPAPRTFALPEHMPSADLIETAESIVSSLAKPYHVLVARSRRPQSSNCIKAHTSAIEELPRGSILCVDTISDTVFSCAPELLFVQIATIAHRIELVRIGCELCGRYALSQANPDGFYSRDPLTTIARMKTQIERTSGLHGAKAARWALQYILPSSASPRETIVAMLLSLPCAMGGRGLEKPSLNHEIIVTRRSGRFKETRAYRIDFYWPSAKLGLEYDSDQRHTGPDRIARDARRRNDLESMGITMLTATNNQVKSLWEFNKLADIVARRLNTQIRPRCKDYPARQRTLHKRLMGKGL